MKNIEEIREKLGPDYRVEEKDGVITVCDIWDGVEFARCVREYDGQFSEGGIYRIKEIEIGRLYFHNDDNWNFNGLGKEHFTPATEGEYIDQLVKEAKERFGEIKDGDSFKGEGFENKYVSFIGHDLGRGFIYQKCSDTLHLNHLLIYKQGKWAKKVDEPIRVNISGFTLSNPYSTITFTASHLIKSLDSAEFANHIEEAIEAYLNKQ